MKYSNELKVGAAIIAAVLIFVFGIRFFRDLPLLQGSYELRTRLEDSGGLVSGNAVRISGVKVGSVEEVALGERPEEVEVRFRVDEGIAVPEGSQAEVTGLGALGGIQLTIQPGPRSNPRIAPGGLVPAGQTEGVLSNLSSRAPQLIGHADSLLMYASTTMQTANATLEGASTLFQNPDSDLRQTLAAVRQSTQTLGRVVSAQEGRLTSVLENAEAASGDLRAFTSSNADSLGLAVTRLNAALTRLNTNLAALDTTTTRLNAITARIEGGDGTLGRLVNDPSLYIRLDSTAGRLSSVLKDLEEHPERYLEDLTLVEIF